MGATVFVAKPAKAADLGGDCCADLEDRVAELEATTVRKGNKKVSVQIYGKVNYATEFWNDGHEQNTYVVNNYNEFDSDRHQRLGQDRWGLVGGLPVGMGVPGCGLEPVEPVQRR